MYRHFYLRLCDVVDMTQLIDSAALDYAYLEGLSCSAGLWDGLATYLVVLVEYAEGYGKEISGLPPSVIKAARFGSLNIKFSQRFLRIPIFPQATNLYAKEWGRLLSNGELENTLRLSLLPGLAAAAALAAKITGSDKGIW
jgi:hypothetical protein